MTMVCLSANSHLWAEEGLIKGTVIRDPFARPDMVDMMDDVDETGVTEREEKYTLRAVISGSDKDIALIVDDVGKEYFVKKGEQLKSLGIVTKITVKEGVTVTRDDKTFTLLKMPRYL